MDEFAKVEKLVEITGATFEDARNALRACEGDMVDSVIYLETLGKVYKNIKGKNVDVRAVLVSEAEKANAEAERAYAEAERIAMKAERKAKFKANCDNFGKAIGDFAKSILRFVTRNQIVISKEGKEFASIPLIIALILCSVSIGFVIVACFVSMMFGYEYSFTGEHNFETANRAMTQAEAVAADVKTECDKI